LYFVVHNPKIGRYIFQKLGEFLLKGSYTHNQQLEAQTLEIKAKNIISKSSGRSKKKDEKVIVDKETRPCEKEKGN